METKPLVFAVKHKNLKTRLQSRSGGIFTALSDLVLNQNGVVYGCALNENFEAVHIRATTKEERNLMRGSKYVQSRLGSIFHCVKKDLDNGLYVLFTGTSCQIDGLKAFLGQSYNNLLTVDIVCHGVPSPLVWKDYLDWRVPKGAEILKVDFRNKVDYGWSKHIETIYFKLSSGKEKRIDSKIYTNLFYGHNILRPACFKCPYKDIIHPADITIADYWHIDEAVPGFNDDQGVSLVLINSDNGVAVFEKVKCDIEFSSAKIEDSMQQPLEEPCELPVTRDEFWKDYSRNSFLSIAKKYGDYGLINLVRRYVIKINRRLNRIVHK